MCKHSDFCSFSYDVLKILEPSLYSWYVFTRLSENLFTIFSNHYSYHYIMVHRTWQIPCDTWQIACGTWQICIILLDKYRAILTKYHDLTNIFWIGFLIGTLRFDLKIIKRERSGCNFSLVVLIRFIFFPTTFFKK